MVSYLCYCPPITFKEHCNHFVMGQTLLDPNFLTSFKPQQLEGFYVDFEVFCNTSHRTWDSIFRSFVKL